MTVNEWYEHARIDAARRGIPELEPLLKMLRSATTSLRRADWTVQSDVPSNETARRDSDEGTT